MSNEQTTENNEAEIWLSAKTTAEFGHLFEHLKAADAGDRLKAVAIAVLDEIRPKPGKRPDPIGKVDTLLILTVRTTDIETMSACRADFLHCVQVTMAEVCKEFQVSEKWKASLEQAVHEYFDQLLLLTPITNPSVKVDYSIYLRLQNLIQPHGLSLTHDPDIISISLVGAKGIEVREIHILNQKLHFGISGIEGGFERIRSKDSAGSASTTIVTGLPQDRSAGNAYCHQLTGKELK